MVYCQVILCIFGLLFSYVCVSEFVKHTKGRTSRRDSTEFFKKSKRYWGVAMFVAEAILVARVCKVTDEVIHAYIKNHGATHQISNEPCRK